ncbi:MAG TPA: hypothetical protein VJ323_15675 [Bryobacteraceae bacterium]|nr:hypothetical protein [Bryobacteraceae bacterium]
MADESGQPGIMYVRDVGFRHNIKPSGMWSVGDNITTGDGGWLNYVEDSGENPTGGGTLAHAVALGGMGRGNPGACVGKRSANGQPACG